MIITIFKCDETKQTVVINIFPYNTITVSVLFQVEANKMPRKYLPKKKHKAYTAETIAKAISLVKNGQSLRSVAKSLEISTTVLHRHIKLGDSIKKKGGQPVLKEDEEKMLVNHLQVCGDWGYPVDIITLRLLIKDYLDRQGKRVKKFKENLPGRDFVYSFLNRHRNDISSRMCQNIKRCRAAVSRETINAYFDELEKAIKDVPPSNIINYDETNLCDDPGRRLVVTRRGCKYPERIMNSSKSSMSVMFAVSADGDILPPYTVYKALHLYDSWRVGGPSNSRYNRTKSGWFDSFCFADWIETIVIPYFSKKEGVKYLIGDNLASHLSIDVIKQCKESDINFVFLPGNSTHLTQPLDVAFFRPMKMTWRNILEEWKKGPGKGESSVPKDRFPSLLKRLYDSFKKENVIAGFDKCGIVPLNRNRVLDMLPSTNCTDGKEKSDQEQAMDDSFKDLLQTLRHGEGSKTKQRRKKVAVTPGKSIGVSDFQGPEPEDINKPSTSSEVPKTVKKRKRIQPANTSSDDDSDNNCRYSLQDSDDELILSTTSEDDFQLNSPSPSPIKDVNIGDFFIIKVFGKTSNNFRLYVCKVLEPDNDGYIGLFYKKIKQTFRFVPTTEEAFFSAEEVVLKLEERAESKTSSRFKGSIAFNNDLTMYTIY